MKLACVYSLLVLCPVPALNGSCVYVFLCLKEKITLIDLQTDLQPPTIHGPSVTTVDEGGNLTLLCDHLNSIKSCGTVLLEDTKWFDNN